MKTFALILTILTAMTSAHAATLDVHGDIKINGKTVITEAGEVVLPKGIDVAKYLKAGNGVAKYNYNSNGYSQSIIVTGDENGLIEEVSSSEEGSSIVTYNGHFMPSRIVSFNSYGDCIIENTFSITTEFSFIPLSESRSIIERYTSTSSCEEGEKIYTVIISIVPLKLTTFTNGDETYSDCLIYQRIFFNWHHLITACVGVGEVESFIYNIHSHLPQPTKKLISFTAN